MGYGILTKEGQVVVPVQIGRAGTLLVRDNPVRDERTLSSLIHRGGRGASGGQTGPILQHSWDCHLAEIYCEETSDLVLGHDAACEFANSGKCKPPAPPGPKSKFSGLPCLSQKHQTAVDLGICDEELCNLAANMQMWKFAPNTDWSKCFAQEAENGDPTDCQLICPGARLAGQPPKGGGGGSGGSPGCNSQAGPAGCSGMCCFNYLGKKMCTNTGLLKEGGGQICFDLRKEKLASGVKPYTDVTYNCGTIGCFPNVKP